MRKLTGKMIIIMVMAALMLTVFAGMAAAEPEDPGEEVSSSAESPSSKETSSEVSSEKPSSEEPSSKASSSKASSKALSSKSSSKSSGAASSKKTSDRDNDGRDLSSIPGASHHGGGTVSEATSKTTSSRTAVVKNVGGIANTLNKWAWLPILIICISVMGMIAINVRAYRKNHAGGDGRRPRGKGQSGQRRTPAQAPPRRRPPDRGNNNRRKL